MPYALTAETGHEWATRRFAALYVLYAGELDASGIDALASQLTDARADGARVAVIGSPERAVSAAEAELADVVVTSVPAPSPFGIHQAMQVAGVDDAREIVLLGASVNTLDAGRRAGIGSVIGIALAGSDLRRQLLDAQPDLIVELEGIAELDRRRFASDRAHRQRVLLNPGPAVVSDRVHRAIGGPDLCHREPEYSDILDEVKRKLFFVAGVADDWVMVMLAGSGTAAMEAMTGASVRVGRKLLVCRNGVYGDRILTIATRLGIETVVVSSSDLEPIHPAAVAAALDADPTIDAVAIIHHETTTGLINPVQAIAAEAARRDVRVVCDAISSLGAEELDLNGTGIDFVASTSNKCLHGLPGCAFVLVSPMGQARIAEAPLRSLYFDLPAYLAAQAKRTVPFTPAIPALYGLDAALDELIDGGIEHRRRFYQARMAYLDGAFAELGLEPRVAPEHRSRSVRSLPLPAGIAYDALHDAVKAEGYVIYGGLGDAAKTTFRVCALGELSIAALEGFIATLERAIGRVPATV